MIPVRVSCDATRLALAEIVSTELRCERLSRPALTAADVMARERPSSSRARALERSLGELSSGAASVSLPFTHDELVGAIKEQIPLACLALNNNQGHVHELATRCSRSLQRRAEGLLRLIEELRNPDPAVGREAA